MSMKYNSKSFTNTVRSVKQETGEIKTSVHNVENHMGHFCGEMNKLSNYVKVK